MKSKRDEIISKGGVLLTAKPFAYILKSSFQGQRCDFCFKKTKVVRCSVCKFVYYCDRTCQKQAWHDHSLECQGLRKVAPRIVPDAARILGKIIMKLRKGGGAEKGLISDNKYRVFKDLMNHYSDLKKDKKRMEHLESLMVILASYLGADKLPNSAELMGIYGRICVNSFSILDPEMLILGTGVYLGATVIDHSCDPNAVAVFEGTTIFIRTLVDVPAPVDWTKVRISYVELLNSTIERRRELQTGYYFVCDCSRCCDTESEKTLRSILCPCGGPVPVPKKVQGELLCRLCGAGVSQTRINAYLEEYEVSKQQLERMHEVAYLDVTKHCLRRQQGLFHPLDLLHAKMLDATFESAISLDQWVPALDAGVKLVQAYRHYYGTCHPLLGILHLKLAKLQNYFCKLEDAKGNIQEATKILEITHGTDSLLYKEQVLPLMEQFL